MERHKKENEMKALDNLYREDKMLFVEEGDKVGRWRYSRSERMIWVPVDKPQFIGWESSLTISETASRRSDGYILFKALAVTKLDQPRFFKDPSVVSMVRRAGKNYWTLRTMWQEMLRRKYPNHTSPWREGHPSGVSHIGDGKLLVEQFEKLEPKEQKYFELRSKEHPATSYREAKTEYWYVIGGLFPLNDLRVHLKVAYSTHKGIPKMEELQRESEIDKILYGAHYYNRKWARYSSWDKREHAKLKASRRSGWKAICNEAVAVVKDSVDDFVVQAEARRIKTRL